MTSLPALDLTKPIDRAWQWLTYKPREWIWEHAFSIAANQPVPSISPGGEADKLLPKWLSVDPSNNGGIDQLKAYHDWANQVLFEQIHSKDGAEYIYWLVESLRPVLNTFFATADASIMNMKALPLMTRNLPSFRGVTPPHAAIVVNKKLGTEKMYDMDVVPVDALGEVIPFPNLT